MINSNVSLYSVFRLAWYCENQYISNKGKTLTRQNGALRLVRPQEDHPMLYGIYSTIGFTLGIIVLTLATSFLIAYGFIRSDK